MDTLALILSIIGCINWGLVGIFRFDLVAWLFGGSGALLSRIISYYFLIKILILIRKASPEGAASDCRETPVLPDSKLGFEHILDKI